MVKVVKFRDSDSEDEIPVNTVPLDAINKQRAQLPMYQGRKSVVAEVLGHQVTVIVGETGSGKSTQLPQALLEADPRQNIVISQPRRVAAISLAQRVAAESDTPLGSKVGYNVRFDAKVSYDTRIRYVTDGMLLREFMLDPMLKKYTTVIVDEAHERTVTSDLVLGLLKQLTTKRSAKKFRIVVMSATLDAEKFSQFFAFQTTKLYVPGRAFPVERFYLREAVANSVDAAAQTALQVNNGEPAGGDILVFLPGQDEIESCADVLRNMRPEKGAPKLKILPLYASLPERDQRLAFAPAKSLRERKVVLATNIAETSVTIPGVRYVIDSGQRKVRMHKSGLGLDSLLPAPISKSSASQRTGRAGREGPGKCWRLYTELTFNEDMKEQTEPEISRVNLAFPILLLKRIGVEDVVNFPWIDPPSKLDARNALLQLYSLTALDKQGSITPFGREMATLPLEPTLAAVLVNIQNGRRKIREAVLDVAACLSVQDLLITPRSERRQEVTNMRSELFPVAGQWGDLILVKLIWDAAKKVPRDDLKDWCSSIGVNPRGLRKVGQVRSQLVGYLSSSKKANKSSDDQGNVDSTEDKSHNVMTSDNDEDEDEENDDSGEGELEVEDYQELIKSFLTGFITNTAIALPDRRFQTTMSQQPISIHPGSTLFGQRPEAIMYLEYVYTTRGYARLVSPIEVDWLRQVAPHLLARAVANMSKE